MHQPNEKDNKGMAKLEERFGEKTLFMMTKS